MCVHVCACMDEFLSVGGTHKSAFITKDDGRSERWPLPLYLHLPLYLSASTPHSLNLSNRHSKWLSWSKFITATSADNQMLSLDSQCLSLWPPQVQGGGGRRDWEQRRAERRCQSSLTMSRSMGGRKELLLFSSSVFFLLHIVSLSDFLHPSQSFSFSVCSLASLTPPLTASPCVGWPMSRSVSLALV